MRSAKKKAVSTGQRALHEKINKSFNENQIKLMKKRYLARKENGEQETPAEMFQRIAHALALAEKNHTHDQKFVDTVEREFFDIMSRQEYTPAGRTITNAGAGTKLIANCIVLPIQDSMESIFQTLKDAALLQQAGSGLGFSFSHLRPAMERTVISNGVSSGPVSFLNVYNTAFGIIKQQGRHGANMAMMRVDHPDVLDFIHCKEREGSIRNFNISVQITDEFMKALLEKPDTQWYCKWTDKHGKTHKMKPHNVIRAANGSVTGVEEIDITVKQLFDEIVHYAWLNGEPGVVFIDEVNRTNPLPGLGEIDCSNPCGEQFLHHYDNCNLGSINLAVFVKNGKFDFERLRHVTKVATRLMDNVIDLFDFPVPQVTELAQKNRRIGLGIMGFADALFQLGIAYDSDAGRKLGEKIMKTITDSAHAASKSLAKEKGAFPNWEKSIFKKKGIKLRNAALTTVAPTGSISMLFECSSGIEPQFALSYIKQDKDGTKFNYFNKYFEAALSKYKFSAKEIEEIKEEVVAKGSIQHMTWLPEKLHKTFVVAMDIAGNDHIKMQAAFQKNVDNSISKTINLPFTATHEDVATSLISAWKLKCKACTVYRDGSRTVQVLNVGKGDNIKAIKDLADPGSATHSNQTAPFSANMEIADQSQETTSLAISDTGITPRQRPEIMNGKTYRLKTGYGNLYVTINNDEKNRPFEVFAQIGKSGGFFLEQAEAICRLISLSLRSGINVSEIVDNLKGIRGPMPTMTSKGTILSLPDAIGQVLQEHVNSIEEAPQQEEVMSEVSVQDTVKVEVSETITAKTAKTLASYGMMPGCPDCGASLTLQEGCMSCKSCGFSRCG